MASAWMVRFEVPDGGGPLLAVKDCIDVAGLPASAGSEVVASLASPAPRDAVVVARARAGGARIAGKTVLTELCWSAAGPNRWTGTPVNPAAPDRLPGGSSGGSAVAVASGEAEVALGTDTGGSVRIPAACCAIAGLKTTWGRIPLDGVYPLAPSLDTVGPLGRSVAALELGMRLIEPGFTALLSFSSPVGRLRPVGDIDPLTDAAVDRALALSGLAVADVAGPDLAAARVAGDTIIDVEGYRSNLALVPYLDRLSPHIQRNMAHGAAITDAELAEARRGQDAVRAWFLARLADYPILVMPTLAGPPPLLNDDHRFSLTVLTLPANVAGLPALALPVRDGPAGLSASLQLIGHPGAEEVLIAAARIIEAALAP